MTSFVSRMLETSRTAAMVSVALLVVCVVAGGCTQDIDTGYGMRAGANARRSVNGTAVLAEMMRRRGHRVSSWPWLSPKLRDRGDCIVWFPNDFNPPSDEVCEWLDEWLDEQPGRKLIYVGRDFDAAPAYWEAVRQGAAPAEYAEISRRLAEARQRHATERLKSDAECPWFEYSPRSKSTAVRNLSGERTWTARVDASQAGVELHGRLRPKGDAEVLLASADGDPIISRRRVGQGELILVTNGSFMLNLPLVNHEHRKLADRLIHELGDGQTVVLLESSEGGPTIYEKEPALNLPNGMAVFGVAPFDTVMLHLLGLGVIFCFARLPIFGIPRALEDPRTSDFGKHVEALGELLERTGDRAYAMSRLLHYQQTVRGDVAETTTAGLGRSAQTQPLKPPSTT